MKPQAILFDLDCTLIDRRKSLHGYAEKFVDDYRAQLDTHDVEATAAFIIKADGGGYREESRYRDIATDLNWNSHPTPEEIEEHWWEFTPRAAVPMEGALGTLRAIFDSEILLGMVTNGSIRMQSKKIDTLGIASLFKKIVISEEVGIDKPDPRIFIEALDGLGVEPECAWFVGDHPEKDIMGAQRLGMRAFWMAGWQEWPENLDVPHTTIHSPAELLSFLRE
ncbi:MAG: HAD family hydrolase [Planctomycetota bacterium]|nr:HAD family hydrolase [Planctomycetota bacterium]